MSTRVTSKYIVSIARIKENEKQELEFREKDLKEIKTSAINHGFWKPSSAFNISYAGLQGREGLDGLDRTKLFMSKNW